MKHLLVVQQYFYPDISAVSQLLFDLLSSISNKYEITVLTGSSFNGLGFKGPTPKEIEGIKIKRIKTVNMGRKNLVMRFLEYSCFYFAAFWHVFKSRKYNLIISMTTPPLIGFFVAIGNIMHNRPLIHYVEDLYPELLFDMGFVKNPWIIRRMALFSRFAYKHSEKIISLGSFMTRKLIWNYGLELKNIIEIDNWVNDVDYIEPKVMNHFWLLYSGNAGMAHDFSKIDLIINEVENNRNLALRFVGGGQQYKAVYEKALRIPEERREFQGYVVKRKHTEVLANGNLLIISQKESTVGDILPSKLYSYLAAGRPILLLGTRKSEIGQLIDSENIGIILEHKRDMDNVIKYINMLSSDYKYYLDLCRRIRQIFESNYTLNHAKIKFVDAIEGVL